MLPIGLVLLLATSALAAPSVELNLYPINDVAAPRDAVGGSLEIVDGADLTTNMLSIFATINDVATRNQALAAAQSLAVLSQLANGVPGSACAATNLINALASNSGSSGAATASFLQSLASSIDSISQLATNPNAARFATGARGNCNGGGRTYSFEAAWDIILANSSPSLAGLANEQYCTSKRLYNAIDVRSNNVGAYLTAASLPPVVQAVQRAIGPVLNFLSAVANGNPGAAAGACRQALLRAL